MALIQCKECAKEVSSKAKVCPSCGAKVPKKTSLFTWLVLIFMLLIVYSAYNTPSYSPKKIDADSVKTDLKDTSNEVKPEKIKAEPIVRTPVWDVNISKDEMTGEIKAFAHSPVTYPKKRMSFPYHDVRTWMGVGCNKNSECAYFGFSDSPNISNDENQDGYSIIKTRIKWDEKIEDIRLTQDWGDKFLNVKNDAQVISQIESANSIMLELKWHGEQSVHFEYSLKVSKKAISDIRSKCSGS